MELVPIIYKVLLYLTVLFLIVLIISYLSSKIFANGRKIESDNYQKRRKISHSTSGRKFKSGENVVHAYPASSQYIKKNTRRNIRVVKKSSSVDQTINEHRYYSAKHKNNTKRKPRYSIVNDKINELNNVNAKPYNQYTFYPVDYSQSA